TTLLAGFAADPPESALALRFMGGIHRLVLTSSAPRLAKYYPSVGGCPDWKDIWSTFLTVISEQRQTLLPLIHHPVQTNEVGRCAALLPGFLEIARQTGLSLRLLELGASAGLNLRWDQYRYEYRTASWGPIDAEVRLLDPGSQGNFHFVVTPEVSVRSGCDIHPIDPTTSEGQLTLQSYVWADQTERLAVLRSALKVAQRIPCEIQRARAADWVAQQLRSPTDGLCSVIFHSIVLQYLSEAERDRLSSAIQRAGDAASKGSPIAWLRMEPGSEQTEIRLQLWPHGVDRVIATAGYHGASVHWLGS